MELIREQLRKISGLDLLEALQSSPEIIRQVQEQLVKRYASTPIGQGASHAPSEYESFLNHPGFEQLLSLVEKTENVNRSNINAVLAVAARNSELMRELITSMNEHFGLDGSEIALFFKGYLEKEKGWKFNKFNRKEGETANARNQEEVLANLAQLLLTSLDEDYLLNALTGDEKPI